MDSSQCYYDTCQKKHLNKEYSNVITSQYNGYEPISFDLEEICRNPNSSGVIDKILSSQYNEYKPISFDLCRNPNSSGVIDKILSIDEQECCIPDLEAICENKYLSYIIIKIFNVVTNYHTLNLKAMCKNKVSDIKKNI